jgi:hypothetical protein
MNEQEIIDLITNKLHEAEQNSNGATEWHARALLTDQQPEAMAHVSKAATQATLLQNLLDEINGAERTSLWLQ